MVLFRVCASVRDLALRSYLRMPQHPMKNRFVKLLGDYIFPGAGVWSEVMPGIELCLHPRDWIEFLLLQGDGYEPQTLKFLAANLTSADCAILAGVNFGLHAAVAAKAVGDKGRIVGIEPQPAALLRANANLSRNGLSARVDLVAVALSQENAFVPFAWSCAANPGAASLFDSGSGFKIQTTTLDAVIAALCQRAPKLLLLDIQGYELQALRGLSPANAPDVIIVEIDPTFLDLARVSVGQVYDGLKNLGYSLHTLAGTPVDAVDTDLPERNVVGTRGENRVQWIAMADA